MAAFDVVGVGVAAVDDIAWVETYPPADAKVRVTRRERHPGGLTATALVAAARLGARCAYAGILGEDEDSLWVLEHLAAEGIETRYATRLPGAGPVRSIIIVGTDRHTRNVFSDASRVLDLPGEPDQAAVGDIEAAAAGDSHQAAVEEDGHRWVPDHPVETARVLLVDHVYPELAIRAARAVRDRGGVVVADLEKDVSPRLPELVELVDHLVLSRPFATRLSGAAEPGRRPPRSTGPAGRRLSPAAPRAPGTLRTRPGVFLSTNLPSRSRRSTRPAAATSSTGPTRRPWLVASHSASGCGSPPRRQP